MTVENAAAIDTGGAAEAGAVVESLDTVVAPVSSETDDMEAAWAKMHPHDNVERGEDGKFVSNNPDVADTQTAELEGAAEGEGQGQSTVPEVPLPPTLEGLDEEWATLSPEIRAKLAERSIDLNNRLANMGRQAAAAKSLSEAAGEFSEYFNGNVRGPNGQPITPADGIRYLANIQRSMDKDPVNTLLSIADTYNIRETVAKALGTTAAPQPQGDQQLLAEIRRLNAVISENNSPERLEPIVSKIAENTALKREGQKLLSSDKDLSAFIQNRPQLWSTFVSEATTKLGESASIEAVFDYAKTQAIEADPTLRAKRQTADKASVDKAAKAEAAKRAAGANVTSTSTGKARVLTDDEAMEAAWNEIQGAA